jgi:hypothetical protein
MIPITLAHGMRVFPISKIAKTEPYIAQLATTPFRWGWDSNHWVPYMLQYPLRSSQQTYILLQLNLTKPPDSLSGSNTSNNRFRVSYRSPMTSTSSAMINSICHIKNALSYPIISFFHFFMGHTPSPRLWVIIILSSTFLLSLSCTQCSMWISFDLISHHYWMPQR